jgi:hypothetical protein
MQDMYLSSDGARGFLYVSGIGLGNRIGGINKRSETR